MSQSDKAAYYQALKAAGVPFTKHYREYSTQELAEAYTRLRAEAQTPEPALAPPPPAPAPPQYAPPPKSQPIPQQIPQHLLRPPQPKAPVAQRDPNEMAGQRLNVADEMVVIRVDPETGFEWYQEEVQKPAYPKARGRRVLTYTETGTKTVEAKSGDYTETFEVAGDDPGRTAQVKITLPSYQVGIYKDRRFPFKVYTYNSNQGFDLFEVQNYYGGAVLVPPEIKRKYVENVLCYDMESTIRAIQTEFRHLQLTGKIK